jgi:hypothetical protein
MRKAGVSELLFDFLDLCLAFGFRRMYSQDGDVLLLVTFLPVPVPGIVADAVDSPMGEEVDDYHPAS